MPRKQEDKESLLRKCRKLLKEAGIDPDDIWSTKFSIDDIIFLDTVSVQEVIKLVTKIEDDPHVVVKTLAKGLESGIIFDWDTEADTALKEVLSDKDEDTRIPLKTREKRHDCRICIHFRDTDSVDTKDYYALCNISGVMIETYTVCDNYERNK